jgi:surface protein
MRGMFSGTKITNTDALATGKNGNPNIWNTGKVTNMGGMFSDATSLTDISGLANWDTSKVTKMGKYTWYPLTTSGVFGYTNVTDFSPISNWDVANVTDCEEMFKNVPTTSISNFAFTVKPGTIDSNGTYIPSD